VPVRLKHNVLGGFERTVLTDAQGVASFEGVPGTMLMAFLELSASDGKPLFKIKQNAVQVLFNAKTGWRIENEPDGFIIETTLVEGLVKQSLNDAAPGAVSKVVAHAAENSDKVWHAFTDKNGRY